MGYSEHKVRVAHEGQTSLLCAIITVSDTRTPASDESGTLIRDGLTARGHQVVGYAIVKDEAADIATRIDAAIAAGAAVVVLNGGRVSPGATRPSRRWMACWKSGCRALANSSAY